MILLSSNAQFKCGNYFQFRITLLPPNAARFLNPAQMIFTVALLDPAVNLMTRMMGSRIALSKQLRLPTPGRARTSWHPDDRTLADFDTALILKPAAAVDKKFLPKSALDGGKIWKDWGDLAPGQFTHQGPALIGGVVAHVELGGDAQVSVGEVDV